MLIDEATLLPASLAAQIRRIVIEQAWRAHTGHIGSALSIADLIAVLYASTLRIRSPEDPERDRFILSKGHAALALYAALFAKGWLSDADLATYCADDTLLGVHPEQCLRGVDFSTGSLGQGLSMGAGAALAARLQSSMRRVFVLLSDAECNEGSVWEAAMFAAHHKLSNLVAVIDMNGQQALGYTRDVLDLSPLAARWAAFGWDTHEVDGHDTAQIDQTLASLEGPRAPHVVVARTTLGKGVSYMQGQVKWHYWPLSEEQYRQAMLEIGATACVQPSFAR